MENETKSTEQQNQNVTRAAGIVSIAVMVSRILGLARETAIGYYFSSKVSADAFYLAFRIPNFLRDMFGEGILSKAFYYHIPRDGSRRRRRGGVESYKSYL